MQLKNICKILLFSLFVVGCSSKEPYEKAIDEYYKSHLNDPSSYELVRMGKPMKVTRVSAFFKVGHEKGIDSSEVYEKAKKYTAELKEQGIDPNEIIAYEVEHRYRAKNSLGALVLEDETVVLDPTMSEVIKVLDNGK